MLPHRSEVVGQTASALVRRSLAFFNGKRFQRRPPKRPPRRRHALCRAASPWHRTAHDAWSLYGTMDSNREEHQRCANKPAQSKRGTSAALGCRLYSDKALKGRHNFAAPLMGFVPLLSISQGVVLGWLASGLWPCCTMQLRTGSGSVLKNLQTRSHPERSGGGKTGAAQSKDPVDLRMIFREICAPNVSPTGFFGCLGSLRMTPFFF